jgi:hypothetical protein
MVLAVPQTMSLYPQKQTSQKRESMSAKGPIAAMGLSGQC